MRRIKITDEFHASVCKEWSTPFQNRSSKFITPLKGLQTLLSHESQEDKIRYLELLISSYEELQVAKPTDFPDLILQFESIIPQIRLDAQFSDVIVNKMRYKEVRNLEYLKFTENSLTKSCAYCNSQLGVTFRKKDNKLKANFELDHFYPKMKHPYLSTSFYNLIPSCSSCNKTKSDGTGTFNLYTEDEGALDLFAFKVDEESLQEYWENNKMEVFKIRLENHPNSNEEIAKTHNELLHIEELYSTQKDIVEELVQKKYIYTEKYIESLQDLFKDMGMPELISKSFVYRLIVGNYTNPEDIHKRPMSKFYQDIARQLKIL